MVEKIITQLIQEAERLRLKRIGEREMNRHEKSLERKPKEKAKSEVSITIEPNIRNYYG